MMTEPTTKSPWVFGQRYRGKACAGEIAVKVITKTGTKYVEAYLQTDDGLRIRWRGYCNSKENMQRTVAELRAMGWQASSFSDWRGLGTRPITFVPLQDEDEHGNATKYVRAAFVRAPLATENNADAAKSLDAEFGDMLANGAAASVDDDEIPF